MRRTGILLILFCISFTVFSQTPLYYYCTYGFTYEMSQQESWGYQKPIVLSIIPSSSASETGLQPNDIIEKINGKETKGEKLEVIDEWMHDVNETQIRVSVSNLKEQNQEVILTKKCNYSNVVSEKDLASSYSFYSLEDIQKRSFVCPFRTTINSRQDISGYKTFGYSQSNENTELDNVINKNVRTALEDKGLTFVEKNPDLIIYSYYAYNYNQNYRPYDVNRKINMACRYNLQTKTMQNLPIYDDPAISLNQAEYSLKLGIRLIDAKLSTPTNLVVVWECESNELLKSNFGLENYCKFHIPLMMMQFPFAKNKESAAFLYQNIKYNYTGINYDLDKINIIPEVEAGSPAARAGITKGDKIEKINAQKLNTKQAETEERYKQFIYNTFNYRDLSTVYSNAFGFDRCAFWNKLKYPQIADIFKSSIYQTTFSYLFYFEPYINPSGSNVVSFQIKRGKEKMNLNIWPEIKQEISFETIRQSK